MPYIKQARRTRENTENPRRAGDLTYAITLLLRNYYYADIYDGNDPYQSICDIRGALVGASTEFERRIVVPFEDAAIKRNGDVY